MKDFMIQSPHTKEECLHALDETLKAGPEVLAKYEYGCSKGDHTGYALVAAQDENAARKMVPTFLLPKAKIVPVDRFTPEAVRALHTK